MKNSNKLLMLSLVALIVGTFSYAFYLEPHVTLAKRELWPGNNPLVPENTLAEMELLLDTIEVDFHYLWTNFSEVKLDPNTDHLIRTFETQAGWEGYTYGKVDLIIERDTLFIRHNNALMTSARPDDTTRVLQSVIVSAGQLRGIEVVAKGKVENLVTLDKSVFSSPISDSLGAILLRRMEVLGAREIKNRPISNETWSFPTEARGSISGKQAPVPLLTDALQVCLRQGGKADLNLEAQHILVEVTGNSYDNDYAELLLSGNCKSLEINHQNAHLSVKAFTLQTDSVLITSKNHLSGADATIRVCAREYLQAEIKGRTNVLFQGDPRIVKQEQNIGRVVNANRYQ